MNSQMFIKILCLAFIAFLLSQCENNVPTAKKNVTAKNINISEVLPNEKVGYIEGNVCYPSDGIPSDMKIYAENLESTKIYMVQLSSINDPSIFITSTKFKIQVPEGDYYVYANTNHASKKHYMAYYSEFVTCGLHAKCESHEPIKVKVIAGKTIINIDPCDWYDRNNAYRHK